MNKKCILFVILSAFLLLNIYSDNHPVVQKKYIQSHFDEIKPVNTSQVKQTDVQNETAVTEPILTTEAIDRGEASRIDIEKIITDYIFYENQNLTEEYIADIKNSIIKHSVENKLDPLLITAVISIESTFYENATSNMDAVGVMQILPSTARSVANEMGLSGYSLTNYEDNINIGTRCLRIYIDSWSHDNINQIDSRTGQKFTSIQMGILSYNGGTVNAGRLKNLKYLYDIENEYNKLKIASGLY